VIAVTLSLLIMSNDVNNTNPIDDISESSSDYETLANLSDDGIGSGGTGGCGRCRGGLGRRRGGRGWRCGMKWLWSL